MSRAWRVVLLANPIVVSSILAATVLVACSSPASSPPARAIPTSPAPAATHPAEASASADGWHTLLPAPPRESIEWAVATPDGRVAAMTPDGPKIVEGDRWVSAPELSLERPTEEAFEVRDNCHVVRRRDRRDYGPPHVHPRPDHGPERCPDRLRARRVFEGSDGHPLALVGARGRLLRWRAERRRMGHVHPERPDGPVGLVVRGAGAGWQEISALVGTELASVVPLSPPVLVSREGDVVQVEDGTDFDRGRPVVTILRPRPLLVLELEGGSVLTMRTDGIRVVARDGGVREVALDEAADAWLARTTQLIEDSSVIPVLGADLGAGRAIVGAGAQLLFIEGPRSTSIHLGESGQTPGWVGEVSGLVGDQGDGWVLLTQNGVVVRGRGAQWRRAGSLSELDSSVTSHPIGAFRGPDGRARLVGFRREIACVTPTGLEICGPVVDIWVRRVHAFVDGLLIDDQSIDLHLVTAAGSRELPLPLPRLQHVLHAGSADALFALTDGLVQQLDADGWRAVTTLPERATDPVVFARTSDDMLVVGLAAGEIIARRVRTDR